MRPPGFRTPFVVLVVEDEPLVRMTAVDELEQAEAATNDLP
jgi:CheY-like chemotaxis protein